ncbi:MAG: TolC family protein [Candidatus Krumholzibacteriia bacterium]
MKPVLSCLLLAAALNAAAAEPAPVDTLRLGLSEAVALALDESFQARSLALDLAAAGHDVDAARGRFRTRADLDLVLPELEERVQGVSVPGELPRYDTYGHREFSAQLSVTQPLPTDGELSLRAHAYHRQDTVYDPAAAADSDQSTVVNSYEVALSQPLLQPNTLKLGFERAEISYNLARRAYARGRLDLSYDVTAAFYDLDRAQQELAIARDVLVRQQRNSELAQRKFAAGLIPEVEALQMEVDLAESQNAVLAAEADLSLTADRFRLLVGLPLAAPVAVRSDLAPEFFPVDPDLALSHALRYRTELADQDDGIRRAEITITETDARDDLRGEITAFYNLTGVSDPQLDDPGLGDLLDSSWDDLRRRPGNRGVRFSLSVPIWDAGVNGAEVASARVALQRRELERENLQRRIVREVKAALANLDGATRRIEVLQRSLAVAERSYGISEQRFAAGDITSQDLASDRDRLVGARRSLVDAMVSYRLAVADLRRQTLYDFQVGRSLVPGAVIPPASEGG